MAKDITLKNADGSVIYYPKTVSDLVYDNDTGVTLKDELDFLVKPDYKPNLTFNTRYYINYITKLLTSNPTKIYSNPVELKVGDVIIYDGLVNVNVCAIAKYDNGTYIPIKNAAQTHFTYVVEEDGFYAFSGEQNVTNVRFIYGEGILKVLSSKSSIINSINSDYVKGYSNTFNSTILVNGFYNLAKTSFDNKVFANSGLKCGKVLLKKGVKYYLRNVSVQSSAARTYAIVNKDGITIEEVAPNGDAKSIVTKEFTFNEDKYLVVDVFQTKLTDFYVIEEHRDIKPLVSNIEDIYNIINQDPETILPPSEKTIIKDGGELAIFKKIAICGDSLGSGEIAFGNATGEDTTQYKDMYEQSWIQFLGRSIGRDAYNFSRGGLSAQNFFTDADENVRHFENADYYSDCYFIALGHNDYNYVSRNWQSKGYSSMKAYETVYIGSSSDINKTNPNANADTYYGNYAKIIQKIHQQVPHAKVFVVTMMDENRYGAYNAVIRDMANIFNNIYVVDMAKYFPNMPSWHYTQGHGNAMGYLAYSQRIATIADWIIRSHRDYFTYTSLILTKYNDGKDYASYIPSSADGSVGSTL